MRSIPLAMRRSQSVRLSISRLVIPTIPWAFAALNASAMSESIVSVSMSDIRLRIRKASCSTRIPDSPAMSTTSNSRAATELTQTEWTSMLKATTGRVVLTASSADIRGGFFHNAQRNPCPTIGSTPSVGCFRRISTTASESSAGKRSARERI